MELPSWFQKHDFSSEDFPAMSVEKVIEKYYSIDWKSELEIFDPNSNDNCPPNFSVHNGYGQGRKDASMLQFRPTDDEVVMTEFFYPVKKSFLGLFKYDSEKTHMIDELPVKDVGKLIEMYFDEYFEEICELGIYGK